jgi:hypothetical protein
METMIMMFNFCWLKTIMNQEFAQPMVPLIDMQQNTYALLKYKMNLTEGLNMLPLISLQVSFKCDELKGCQQRNNSAKTYRALEVVKEDSLSLV